MPRRTFVAWPAVCLLAANLSLAQTMDNPPPAANATPAGEKLYNGIVLPREWPPRLETIPDVLPTPPYLESPPEVIPIDVGRQLFVDDFLIQDTTLSRRFHQAQYYPDNPILKPEMPWERGTAMPFSDGVWYDPADGIFKMWYMPGMLGDVAYATSNDGIHWEKPMLDVKAGTNIVLPCGFRDSSTVWIDIDAKDPAKRYVIALWNEGRKTGSAMTLHFSGDGIHWGPGTVIGGAGDRTTFYHNPFRNVWVWSVRDMAFPRTRRYLETAEMVAGKQWGAHYELTPWCGADRLDPPHPDIGRRCELYNLDGVAYESIVLGLFSVWRGEEARLNRPKINEVCAGFSRDGFNWDRPNRKALIPVSEQRGDWNFGNVQSTSPCCLVVKDRLYFYVSGRQGGRGAGSGLSQTGLAILRRDGFASMEARAEGGVLTTRKLTFSGNRLFVNVDVPEGELRAEVLDAGQSVIGSFSKANCVPVRANKTMVEVTWKGAPDLAALAGKPVRLRFHLTNGSLYAFWVSPDVSGASHGYVAGGGPGFPSYKDTVGSAIYGGPVLECDAPRDAPVAQKQETPPRADLLVWLKADALTGLADGAAIAAWPDSFGRGNDATQSGDARKPAWHANAVNGLPAVTFDGKDDTLRLVPNGLLFGSYGMSVFVVFKNADSQPCRALLSQGKAVLATQHNGLFFQVKEEKWGTASTRLPGPITQDQWQLATLVRQGPATGETALYVNGVRNDWATPVCDFERGEISIGSQAGSRFWKGDIAEVLVYGKALSDGAREGCEAYLRAKYGIAAASLPASSATAAAGKAATAAPAAPDMAQAVQAGQAPAITNIIAKSGKKYVADMIQPGALCFIDRPYKFTHADGFYGMQFLRPSNDDKTFKDEQFLSFDVNMPVTVHVAYVTEARSVPDWLAAWTLSRDKMRSDTVPYKVYARDFPAGTVVLGGNAAAGMNGAGSTYIALVSRQNGAPVKLMTGPAALQESVVGVPYSAAFTATGPIRWDISDGAPPAGMNLDPVTGLYDGIPTETGTFAFTVRASGPAGRDTHSFTHVVKAPPAK